MTQTTSNNLAIIPVRTGSKRIPNKNTRDFFGKPLFVYSLICAKESGLFSDVVLTTESPEVMQISKEYGFGNCVQRPQELAADDVSLEPVCLHVLDEMKKKGKFYDKFCLLYPTSPMRSPNDINKSYQLLDESVGSVWSVTDYNITPYWALDVDDNGCVKATFGEYYGMQSQDLPPQPVVDAGSIYWYWVAEFIQHKKFLLEKTRAYKMDRHSAIDLDTEEDWMEMELFYQHKFVDNA